MRVAVIQLKMSQPQLNNLDYDTKVFEEQEYADLYLSKLPPGSRWRYKGETKYRTIPEVTP